MSNNTFNDNKFSVEQVELMTRLYESGLTADDVVAGFRQIQDFRAKFGPATSPQRSTNENSQDGFTYSQLNNTNQSSNHSFVSPQSGFIYKPDVSYQTKTPTSVNTSSTPSMVLSPTSPTYPKGETKSSNGRRKKPICKFVVTDEDRDFFSPPVVKLMEEDTVDVCEKINLLMKRKNLKIKKIIQHSYGALSYSYLNNWLKNPNINKKKRVALLYEWYVQEVGKGDNENRQSSFSYSQPNNSSQSCNHSFVSPKSGYNSQQNVFYQTKTPTSVNTSSTPSMVFSHPSYTQPKGKLPKVKRRAAGVSRRIVD